MSQFVRAYENPIDFEKIRQEFLAKYETLMKREGLDAVFLTKIENVVSVTRFRAPFGRSHYVMRYGVLLSPNGLTFFVRDGDYDRVSRRMPWLDDVRETPNFLADAITVIKAAFSDHGVNNGTVGSDLLPLGAYRSFREAMPNVEFEDIDRHILDARTVKSPEEIKVIQVVTEIVEKAMEVGLRAVRPGVRESEVSGKMADVLTAEDVEGPSLPPMLITSDHLGTLHRHYTDAQIRESDICRLDVTAVWNNYVSDFGRSMIVGQPSPIQREVARAVFDAHLECIKVIRPGIRASEVDKVARDVIEKAGFKEYAHRHFTGHGVGLSHQEWPMVGEPHVPENDMTLQPGMVIAIEPGIKFQDQPRLGGIWFEDLILVTESSHEYMTRTAYDENLLGFYAAPPGPWNERQP